MLFFFKMLEILEILLIWQALGIEITFLRKFENYHSRLKSGIKNQNKLKNQRFRGSPSKANTVFLKFAIFDQMPDLKCVFD